MPRLNSLGNWCAGIGGGQISVDGVFVFAHQSGGACWVDDDRVIGQLCAAGAPCITQTWNRLTHALVQVAAYGTQNTRANGGVWAIWGDNHGVTTSTGLYYPLSAIGEVGPDGAIAIKTLYQSYGPWDVIEVGATGNDAADFLSGKRWQLTPGDASDICLLGAGKAIWKEDGAVRARGLTAPVITTSPFWWLRARQITGTWWVLYQDATGRLLLHPFDSTNGYVVASGNTYRPDFVSLGGGIVRVVWAVSEGERPGDIAYRDIDLTSTRIELGSGGTTPFDRPLWKLWFIFTATNSMPAGLPGNGYAQVGPIGAQLPEIFLYDLAGVKIAQYVAAEQVGQDIETEIAAARVRNPELQVVAYWTRADFGGPVPSADWVGVEAYRLVGETVAAFDAAIRVAVARVPKAILIPQVFSSNGTLTADLLSIPSVVAQIARDNLNVVGFLNFSGAGRATGYQDHPEVWPIWTSLFSSSAGLPPPAPPPGTPGGPGGPPPVPPFRQSRRTTSRARRRVRRSPRRWV